MFGNLFRNEAPLPEESIDWLFDGFGWALQNFGSERFFQDTRLIEPNNRFFAGKGDSVEEMAALIFSRVREYCGLDNWPCELKNHHEFDGHADSLPALPQVLQARQAGESLALTVFYEPQQVANPNAMIANYVQSLAHHLATLAHQSPPCEPEQWPHLMELLGVYMGFGIMFTNTAIPKRSGGCGSCGNPAQERQGAMTEMEVLYAMAIFCVLKDIPLKQVSPHIKAYLKPLLTKAFRDVTQRTARLERLRGIREPHHVRGEMALSHPAT